MCKQKYAEAACTYQAERAVLGPQHVGEQTWQGGLVPPAPAGRVEVRWDRKVKVRQKTSQETQTQRHEATKRELLFKIHSKDALWVTLLSDSDECFQTERLPLEHKAGAGPREWWPAHTEPGCAGYRAPSHSTTPPNEQSAGGSTTRWAVHLRGAGGHGMKTCRYLPPARGAFSAVKTGGQGEEEANEQVVEGEDLRHHRPLPAQPGTSKQPCSQDGTRSRTAQPEKQEDKGLIIITIIINCVNAY